MILDDLGLVEAVKSLLEEFRLHENLKAKLHTRNSPELIPYEVAGVVYRITQEALQYISGNAAQTEVEVLLEGSDSALRLEIALPGGSAHLRQIRRSLELVSMAERARLVRGVVGVESRVESGAVICVEIPLSARDGGPPL